MVPEIEKQTLWQNFKNFSKCKTWILGFSLTIIQWFPLMIAIRIGSLSVVAPTMVIGFIVLIIFSWFYLKEPIRIIEIISMIIVIGAIVTLYIVAPIKPVIYDLTQLNGFFKETKAIVFICSFAALIVILVIITYGKQFPQAGGLLAIASGLSYATAIIFSKAAISTLDFSSAADFAKNLVRWEWYVYLALMCVFYAIAFPTQQMAFQKGKTMVVTPTVDVMNIFLQVTGGILIFNEWFDIWGGLELWKKALKITSLVLIIISVAMLSFLTAKDEIVVATEVEEKEEGEVDEAVQEIN